MILGWQRGSGRRWDRDGWLARAGLTGEQVSRLAVYNSEVHRGLVHTAAYAAEMAELQRRFDTTPRT